MSRDPLTITAREMIDAAEQERDLALGQLRLIQGDLATAQAQVAALIAELKPSSAGGPLKLEPETQRRQFSERVVDYIWRSIMNAKYDDDGFDDVKGRVTDWLEYRLEHWSKS